MKSIPRSIYIGVLVALAVFFWGMAGYLSQVIHGTPVGVTFAEVVGMAASAAGLMGAIAWGLMAGFPSASMLTRRPAFRCLERRAS